MDSYTRSGYVTSDKFTNLKFKHYYQHNVDNHDSESNLKFGTPQKVIETINKSNNYSQLSLNNYDTENIIKSKQTPQKITELIKNDQSLQTYTIDYMKLDELPNLQLPYSSKNFISKSSKRRSASENCSIKMILNTLDTKKNPI